MEIGNLDIHIKMKIDHPTQQNQITMDQWPKCKTRRYEYTRGMYFKRSLEAKTFE